MPAQTNTNPRHGILMKTTPSGQGLVKFRGLDRHLQFHDIGGRHPRKRVVAALEGALAAADTLVAILSLAAKGCVVSADQAMDRCRAPGRCHSWARFAPERLSDAPVSVGCRKHLRTEADLNSAAAND